MVYVSESHLSRLLLQLVGFSYVMDGGSFHITNKTFLGTMHSIYVYLIQVLKKLLFGRSECINRVQYVY